MFGLVTVVQLPLYEPQVPFASGAVSRSMTPLAASTPEPPVSTPLPGVIVTEPVVFHPFA